MEIMDALEYAVSTIKTWVNKTKVSKIDGKDLSTNDYTDSDKTKVDSITLLSESIQSNIQRIDDLEEKTGSFYITAIVDSTEDGPETYCTVDKTMAQIVEAYNAGQSVYLLFPYLHFNDIANYCLIPVVHCTEYAIGFGGYLGSQVSGNIGDVVYDAFMEDDEGFWVYRKNINETSTFYVTATTNSTEDASETGCTSDKTKAEIIEAYNAGKSVYLRFPYLHVNGNAIYCLIPLVCCTSCIGFYGVLGSTASGNDEILDAWIEEDDGFTVYRKQISSASNVSDNSIVLTDQNTGVKYKVYVLDGKLTMDQVET